MIRQSTTRGSASTAAYATINGAIWAIYVALVLLVTQVLAFAEATMQLGSGTSGPGAAKASCALRVTSIAPAS
jgi:hypothetical protein